jgi:predicted AlkP superfamily pyrophosphatase or phosphodiesterase
MKTISQFSLLIAILFSSALLIVGSCKKESHKHRYLTEHVFIVVVDGARFTDTWGEPSHQFIPNRFSMLQEAVFCSNFRNNAFTYTCSGHQAMCTGVYESINNNGTQLPNNPSIFQYWLKKYSHPNTEAWVIATKDKLEVLSDCLDPNWKGQYRPSRDCGVNGLFTGYREDSVTFQHLKSTILANDVRMAIINFKQPDAAGHAGDSLAYLQGILDTDQYIAEFWEMLQSNPTYKDKTTLIVTNDHGRHTAGHADGYISHGDKCEGCTHVEFFALGPDFKKNFITSFPYEQIDIAPTIAELMGFEIPTSNGKVMWSIFKP